MRGNPSGYKQHRFSRIIVEAGSNCDRSLSMVYGTYMFVTRKQCKVTSVLLGLPVISGISSGP